MTKFLFALISAFVLVATLMPVASAQVEIGVDAFGGSDRDADVAKRGPDPKVVTVRILGSRNLTAACADALAQFPNLRRLELEPGTVFRGKAIARLAAVKSLRELVIEQPSNNYFDFPGIDPVSDYDLAEVAKLSQLESVDVQGRRVTSSGIAALARLPELRSLTIRHWEWTDEPIIGRFDALLGGLDTCPKLESLTVHVSRLGNDSVRAVAKVKMLRELRLNADISSADLTSFHDHPTLEILRGDKTMQATGLDRLPKLTAVYRGDKQLDLPFLRTRRPARNTTEKHVAALVSEDPAVRNAAVDALRTLGVDALPDLCRDMARFVIAKDSAAAWAWRIVVFGESLTDAQLKVMPACRVDALRPGVVAVLCREAELPDEKYKYLPTIAVLIATLSVATDGAILPEVQQRLPLTSNYGPAARTFEAIAEAHLAELERILGPKMTLNPGFDWSTDVTAKIHINAIRACGRAGQKVIRGHGDYVTRQLNQRLQDTVGRRVMFNSTRKALGLSPVSLQETAAGYIIWAGPPEARLRFLERLYREISPPRGK